MISLVKKTFIIFILLSPLCAVHASQNELKTLIRTVYPDGITTVRALVGYIVEGTEYKIYTGRNAPTDARSILAKRIPYQRPNILMTRTDAILMAIGDKNAIVVDHDKKLISFTRSPLHDS